MNKRLTTTLKSLLSGALLFGAASLHAQTAGNPTDTAMHHRYGMHRWGNPNGGGSPNGYAHRGFGHNGHHGFGRNRFGGEHIRYTPEQRKQVASINLEYRQKRADLYKQDNLTLKQYKAGLLALEKEKKSKMAALLTPDQKDEMAANHKRMDENIQVREVAHLERLKLHLNLTDDQVAKLKAGNTNLRTQARAIHENDNLLPEQKMEQMQALIAKRNDIYKSILTPDQYTQFQNMMSHRRARGSGLRRSPGQL